MKRIIALVLLATVAQAARADKYDDDNLNFADQAQHCFALGLYMRNVVFRGKYDGDNRQKYIDALNSNLDNGDKLGIGEENRDLIVPAVNYTYDEAPTPDRASDNAEIHLCIMPKVKSK